MEDLADPELVIIINITENKVCNDCQKKNPRWCSINNAVLLCPSCARKHQKYNNFISKIKSLEGELWTKDEIKRLYIGGNERFNKMLTSYNIPLTIENAEYKYHTKIAAYYRNLLSEELKGKKIIDLVRPSLKEGIELICKEDYDKLNEYIPSQDNILQNNNNSNNNSNVLNVPKSTYTNPFASDMNNNNENSYNNKNNSNNNRVEVSIEKHLNDFVDVMDSIFGNISQKAENNERLKKAEVYIQDKKEKVKNSDAFQGFVNALSSSIDNFVKKTEDFFNDAVNNNRKNSNSIDNRNLNQSSMNNNINFNNNNNLNQKSLNKNINNKGNQPINNNSNIPLNNLSNNNMAQNQNNINNINIEDIDTPEGGDDINKLIYSNNPQNINIQGEHKNDNIEGDVERLDGN